MKRRTTDSSLPRHFKKFTKAYPDVLRAYETLGDAVHTAGPLDEKTRALVKLGIAVGAGFEGGVHAQVRRALEVGISPDEIRHVVILSLPTIGFPSMSATLSWVEDIIGDRRRK